MLRDVARSLWAEPRAPDPPARLWRDWALVIGLVPIAVLEGVLADELVWRVASVVIALVLAPVLLWRRAYPLASVLVAFGLITTVEVASLVVGADWRGLDSYVFLILLVYALFRWGSGREAAVGLAFVSLPVLLSAIDAQVHAQDGEGPGR